MRRYLEELADSGAEAVGVDWTVSLGEARRRTGGQVALQGNLDPATLYASPDVIRAEVAQRARRATPPPTAARATATCSTSATACRRTWIPNSVRVLVDAVHAHSRRPG